MIGTKSGRLTVVSMDAVRRHHVVCKCECGTVKEIYVSSIRLGKSKSCGCERKRLATKHGGSRTQAYQSWNSMLNRCSDTTHTQYAKYGGAGIDVCERWLSFANFLEDMGPGRAGMTIDRIDNSLGYSKSNCRWATKVEQACNRKTNRFVTINGKKMTLSEAAQHLNTNPQRVRDWVLKGVTGDEIAAIVSDRPTVPRERSYSVIGRCNGDTGVQGVKL